MTLTNNQVIELLKEFRIEANCDHYLSTAKYKNSSINYSCDLDEENWDFSELCYYDKFKNVIMLEFTNEQIDLLKNDLSKMIEELVIECENKGDYVPYSRSEEEYQRYILRTF